MRRLLRPHTPEMSITLGNAANSKVEDLKIEADKLREEIKLHPIYFDLTKKQQKSARQGNWRLGEAWHDLAQNAGFSEEFFKAAYSTLSTEAHTGKTSIHRLQNVTQKNGGPPTLLFTPIKNCLIILGQLLHLYPTLFGGFSILDLPEDAISKARIWKEVGDRVFKENII